MLDDPFVRFLAAHDINAQALVAAIAAVIVLYAWGWVIWAVIKGTVR